MLCIEGIIDSPIGAIGFSLDNQKLTKVMFLKGKIKTSSLAEPLRPIAKLLADYFRQPNTRFDELEIALSGSTFSQLVWRQVRKIPVGSTLTYGELAKQLGSHPRAVGQALKCNPIPIVVPCHRVVAQKDLGGFMGRSKQVVIKEWLLRHERSSP